MNMSKLAQILETSYKQGIASYTIPSHCTIFLELISSLDVYSFANVHGKGIVAFKHLKQEGHDGPKSLTWV